MPTSQSAPIEAAKLISDAVEALIQPTEWKNCSV
jgi:hypothetical protein